MTNSAAPERSLRPGGELDLLFTDLLANGQAVGRAEGLVVFCFGPLPGERARVRVTTVKKSYAVADPLEIEASSPDRARPFCPVFDACGGCQVQHLAYEAQLRWKREMVGNALQRIGGLTGIAVREPVGMASPREYRNKISLVIKDRAVGFYRMRSHDLVPITACPVALPELNRYVRLLATAPPGSPVRAVLDQARHVVVRYARATNEAVLAISTQCALRQSSSSIAGFRSALHDAIGIINAYEPRSANAVLGSRQQLLDGRAEIEERIAGIRYRVSTASFFQINPEIVGRIFESIERELLPARRVVDLYCGMGTFSLLFAKLGANVTGVEENAHATAEAHANARLNGLDGQTVFHRRRVETFVASREGREAISKADLVFLDPPRKGCDEAALRALTRAGAPKIGYLSCDPATLARDLKTLSANGYGVSSVQPFDMFPQTGHVEALAILVRSSTEKSPRSVA